jgi:hypothetical protein
VTAHDANIIRKPELPWREVREQTLICNVQLKIQGFKSVEELMVDHKKRKEKNTT